MIEGYAGPKAIDPYTGEPKGTERHCERCGKLRYCEEIPLMGYSEYMCRWCAAAAYRNEEAV